MITLTIDYGTVASILIPVLIIALVILFFYSMDVRDEIDWRKMENDMCHTNLRDCRRKSMKLKYEYDELMKNYKDLENKRQALKKDHNNRALNVNTARLNLNNAVEDVTKELLLMYQEEEDMRIDKIRRGLRKRMHHQSDWDKHVSIIREKYTPYTVLKCEYNDHEVEARSKDYDLLYCLKQCIEMYLEEKEEK